MKSFKLISDGKPEKIGNNLWQLTEDYVVLLDGSEYRVSKGYLTDLASVPFPLNLIYKKDPDKAYSKAAVWHDLNYTHKTKNTYWQTQITFYRIMSGLGESRLNSKAMFLAVLLFSWVFWLTGRKE